MSNAIVDPEYGYMLRKAGGSKPVGSKWKFNTETKEFVAYTENAGKQQTDNG